MNPLTLYAFGVINDAQFAEMGRIAFGLTMLFFGVVVLFIIGGWIYDIFIKK
jgi:hypothetical protein